MSKIDWKEMKNEYICSEMSYRALAEKYKIAPSRVSAVGKKQNWVKKRDTYRSNVAQVTLHNARATEIKNKSQKLNNLIEAADKLAVKLNEALDDPEQLYRQILRTSSGAEAVRTTKKLDTRALKDFASTISTMNDTIKQLNDLTEDEDKKNVEIKIIEGKKEWAQ